MVVISYATFPLGFFKEDSRDCWKAELLFIISHRLSVDRNGIPYKEAKCSLSLLARDENTYITNKKVNEKGAVKKTTSMMYCRR